MTEKTKYSSYLKLFLLTSRKTKEGKDKKVGEVNDTHYWPNKSYFTMYTKKKIVVCGDTHTLNSKLESFMQQIS